MGTQRKTGKRDELNALWAAVNGVILKALFGAREDPGIGNGTTAGNLRTTAAADFTIDGFRYTKASTDDLWDLSGETDTAAGTFRAYWLYLDSAGAASFVAGGDRSSAALALAALPAHDSTKTVMGVYVAGAATDFDDAGGLAAQGTIYDGVPAGVPPMGVAPVATTLVAP